MTKRAAIIISGGNAKRFQGKRETWQDKALVELFGKPLLIRAVENVRDFVEEIVIIVNDEKRRARYSEVLTRHHIKNVRVLVDEKSNHLGGPLVAILTGLKSVAADYCLTLPCDMPMLQPKVTEYLFNASKDYRVVVPMWPNGRIETLIMVLERKSALEIANTLYYLKRPRSDDIVRGALNVIFPSIMGEIRALDPELKSFININYREDLTQLLPRRVQGPVTENMQLNLGALPTSELQCLRDTVMLSEESKFSEVLGSLSSCTTELERKKAFFWAAVSRENEGRTLLKWAQQKNQPEIAAEQFARGKEALLRAASNYGLEAEMHAKSGYVFLAERARSDKSWCETYVTNLAKSPSEYRETKNALSPP